MALYTVTTKLNTELFPTHTSGEWANLGAFAMLKADGSVVTWGGDIYGGDSAVYSQDANYETVKDYSVADQLDGRVDIKQIYSSRLAFAALRADGSVVSWGYKDYGGITVQ